MTVAGIQVRDHAVAELAMLLHEAGHSQLAQRIGNAFDTNQRELRLTRRDLPIALEVLEDCPEELAQLRGALLSQYKGAARQTPHGFRD
jgi:hypothetical protein